MNKYIDHTLLKPEATITDIKKLCEEAERYQFASVCISPAWVKYVKSFITKVPIVTVIGFPHGNITDDSKFNDIMSMAKDGASEFDVVVNIGNVKSGLWKEVELEIKRISLVKKFRRGHKDLKIKYIVEVGFLNDEELFKTIDLLIKYKIDFVKTCTGYGPRNVTTKDIINIKKYVGNNIKIKASGGIKTTDFAKQLIEAGADRIGCSASISIINSKR